MPNQKWTDLPTPLGGIVTISANNDGTLISLSRFREKLTARALTNQQWVQLGQQLQDIDDPQANNYRIHGHGKNIYICIASNVYCYHETVWIKIGSFPGQNIIKLFTANDGTFYVAMFNPWPKYPIWYVQRFLGNPLKPQWTSAIPGDFQSVSGTLFDWMCDANGNVCFVMTQQREDQRLTMGIVNSKTGGADIICVSNRYGSASAGTFDAKGAPVMVYSPIGPGSVINGVVGARPNSVFTSNIMSGSGRIRAVPLDGYVVASAQNQMVMLKDGKWKTFPIAAPFRDYIWMFGQGNKIYIAKYGNLAYFDVSTLSSSELEEAPSIGEREEFSDDAVEPDIRLTPVV
ncbi:hypothetical protein [Rhizobium sp. FKY42]|uniref:hypothetical protein n=1 Tax=Rhizobium sp. FKY42 TaxID=2562310 RepID=UPI0010C06A0E|nr:hypothetical protein [Rhizobium sp. FKY42]